MHNSFVNSELEERLKDFQQFEHDLTDDVWNNIEGELLVNNAISNLSNLEFDVDESVWGGIEDNLTVKRPKTAIWWLPGLVGSLLLLTLGYLGLNDINQKSSSDLAVVSNQNEILKNDVDGVENSSSNKVAKSSKNEQNKNSSTQHYNLGNENTTNSKFDQSENEDAIADLINNKSNSINSSKFISSIVLTSALENDVDSNEPFDILDDRGSSLQNTLVNSNETITPGNDDEVESISILAMRPTVLHPSFVNRSLIDDKIEEDDLDKKGLSMNENEEDDEKTKKSWKLIALGGIGSFTQNYRFYDAKKPIDPNQFIKVNPNGPNNAPRLPVEPEPVNEGKIGLNSVLQYIPVNFSLATQKNITNRFGLRVGVGFTSLKSDFTIYEERNSVKLNYLSVPLTLVYKVVDFGKLNVNVLALARGEKLVSHQFYKDFGSGYEEVDTDLTHNGSNLAVGGGLELEYELSNTFSIISNAQISKYIKTDDQKEYNRLKQNYYPEVNLGISTNF